MEPILDNFKLDGKIALVTGGSDGIGKAIAIGLAQAGAIICINGRSKEKLEIAQTEFESMGIKVFVIAFDVSDENAVSVGITTIEEKVGPIDILINNAGIIKRTPIIDMEVSDFKEVLDVNLVSVFMISKRVVPNMIKNGGGKIVNICSLMSHYGRNSVAAYASAKGGLTMLTKNMCVEWGRHNIQVNGVAPGYIVTAKTEDFAKTGHTFNDLVLMRTPASRWGKVEDLCGTAVFLSSKAGEFINGQVIFVDGGITANMGYQKGENIS